MNNDNWPIPDTDYHITCENCGTENVYDNDELIRILTRCGTIPDTPGTPPPPLKCDNCLDKDDASQRNKETAR